MECIHEDESTHKWAEYGSMQAVVDKNKRNVNPKIIICPVCNRRGRVNAYHPNKQIHDHVEYLVTHEKVEGMWGKDNKIAKRRRCYIKKPNDRVAILKKLGRYIPPVNTLQEFIEK